MTTARDTRLSRESATGPTNPVKAIRAKCIDCCGGQPREADRCPSEFCPLHPFRFGKNPYRKPPSEAQLAQLGKVRKVS